MLVKSEIQFSPPVPELSTHKVEELKVVQNSVIPSLHKSMLLKKLDSILHQIVAADEQFVASKCVVK
jgi:hypothetical protein